jgi:hypothetical protein
MLQFHDDKLKSTILKIGHHGSSSSTSIAFLNEVSPKVVVFSVGKGNSFGHPTPIIWDRVSGSILFRTDEQETIILITDGKQYAAYSPSVSGQYMALAAYHTPSVFVTQPTTQPPLSASKGNVYVAKNRTCCLCKPFAIIRKIVL